MSDINREIESKKQLAINYYSRGMLNEAVQLCHEICSQADESTVYSLLGVIHGQFGQYRESVQYCRKALQISPGDTTALSCLGNALRRLNDFEGACAAFMKVIALTPGNYHAHYHLGLALESTGRFKEAIRHYRTAYNLNPAYLDARAGEASALNKLGEPQKAYDLIAPLAGPGKTSPQIAVQYGLLSRKLGGRQSAINRLEEVLANTEYHDDDRLQIHFILGALLDDSGEYARAFSHYSEANRLKGAVFDADAFSNGISRLIERYNSETAGSMARASIQSERLVFIVGMPRSGTSLVEQILSSHPEVYGAGELTGMITIATELAQSSVDITALDTDRLNGYAKRYLDHAEQLDHSATRIIDKLPDNFLRLGLINALFPGARIIHCRRHPADTCLSCYFQNFSRVLAHTFDLESIGKYYLDYHRLMQHWQTALSLPILDVEYEKLVTEPEKQIQRLIEFTEISPHEACLSFHENKRFANTASYDQVRRPLYTNSTGRWHNYRDFLQPLLKILETLPDSDGL